MIKKLRKCVIYGNCHMGGIANVLNNIPQFTAEYEICPIKFIQEIDIEELLEDPILSDCDLFIHQCIQQKNIYGLKYASDYVIKKLKPQCKIIAIPNLYGMPTCLFPQYIQGKTYNCKLALERISFYRDSIIEDALYDGKKIKDIVKLYQDVDIYSREKLEVQWERFIEKVKIREQDWDVKISNYIMEKVKKERLFFDPGHPTPLLIKHVAYELLKLLGIYIDEKEVLGIGVEPLVAFEMPICGAVQTFLGINSGYMLHRALKMIPGGVSLYKYILQYSSLTWRNSGLPVLTKIKCFMLFCLFYLLGNSYNMVKLLLRKIYLYKERSYKC